MIEYEEKSGFFKLMTSIAIGLSMDEDQHEEKEKAQEFFDYLDTDPEINHHGTEGILTNPDILENLAKILADQNDGDTDGGEQFEKEDDWHSVFYSMDLDGDWRVDFHEFYAAVIDHQTLFSDKTISNLYRIFDP